MGERQWGVTGKVAVVEERMRGGARHACQRTVQ